MTPFDTFSAEYAEEQAAGLLVYGPAAVDGDDQRIGDELAGLGDAQVLLDLGLGEDGDYAAIGDDAKWPLCWAAGHLGGEPCYSTPSSSS